MITLKNLVKDYKMPSVTVHALKNINLKFRKNEFVSVLGPSGCGKTTLLNIIGGLDKYDSGDLLIDQKSTKDYKDRDWDTYRNHYVGFVFQSYNLIMHLTVIENVEIALSIAGYNKAEKTKKATEALQKVGLIDQMNKKPNQLSGGQMQRVAIARAIVNDPQIILADEPTGALDTETSVQILQILKELSNERLVVMVTHNEDLAEKYSTRIVKMLDGNILSDSNPTKTSKQKDDTDSLTIKKQTSMSFFTALKLSFRNLITKKARTLLTAFAGSIGIIGIALILALSTGFQAYIDTTERDTLSSYPLIIEQTPQDYFSTATIIRDSETDREIFPSQDEVYVKSILENLITNAPTTVHTNNLSPFKQYLEENIDYSKINSIQYVYDFDLNIYSSDYSEKVTQLKPLELSPAVESLPMIKQLLRNITVWQELMSNTEVLQNQYELLGDSIWPSNYDEIVVMLDSQNQISDVALYALGLESVDKIEQMINYIYGLTETKPTYQENYDFESLLNKEYKVVLNTDYYQKLGDIYEDIRIHKITDNPYYTSYMQNLLDNSLTLKIVGIVRPSQDSISSPFSGAIGYTPELTEYLANQTNQKQIVIDQIANPETNIFTNAPYEGTDSYLKNLSRLSVVDLDNPEEINIYPLSFENKEYVIDFINTYNNQIEQETDRIEYTDYVGLLMSSVTTILNAITYVLIAFVSISLIVSSIMIGVITYISVLERTNEIGILRSVGARKKDISRVFNAETLLIGFTSGAMGIITAYILCIPLNLVIQSFIEINAVAILNVLPAAILIFISMLLTFIAGLLPSKIAAKKDPVKALRYE